MSAPVDFEGLAEGWAVLWERLNAIGVVLSEQEAKDVARAVVLETVQRGHVVALSDHRRAVAYEVEVATRPLREQLARIGDYVAEASR